MTNKRLPKYSSKPLILQCAVQLAKEKGLRHFSRDQVAAAASISAATVSFHFGNMDGLRKVVVRNAVKNEIVSIVADARAERNTYGVLRLTPELKQKVANHIAR